MTVLAVLLRMVRAEAPRPEEHRHGVPTGKAASRESDRTLAASHGQPVGGVAFGPGAIGRAFDLDGSGADLIGGHDGALENGAGFADGWTREGLALDGVNDRVRTGNVALGSEFTVVAWVDSAKANQTAYRRIVETSFSTHFALTTGTVGTNSKFIVRSPGGAARRSRTPSRPVRVLFSPPIA